MSPFWSVALAALMLLGGVGAMQWGSSRAADLLDAVRGRWGLPATAGGALMGLATAAPETAVNLSSVAFGWPDLGLGAALGSNVPALPLAVLLSYLAAKSLPGTLSGETPFRLTQRCHAAVPAGPAGGQAPAPRVAPQAAEVQAWPYLGVVLLLAALTLPPPIAGLQWPDGLALLAAFGCYLAYALLRRPWVDRGTLPPGAVAHGSVGLPAIAVGAVVSVMGAQRLGGTFGVPDIATGLFAIGLLCALPESYSAWRFTREGKPTVAIASVMGDGIVSLTVALLPSALVGAGVGNRPLYLLNLGFLAAVLVIYILLNRRSGEELGRRLVWLYTGGYAAYLAATLFLLTHPG